MGKISVFLSGLWFGAGLNLSVMVKPMQVLNFHDIPGPWDHSLILVMASGLMVTVIAYQFIFRRSACCLLVPSSYPSWRGSMQVYRPGQHFSVWAGARAVFVRPCPSQPWARQYREFPLYNSCHGLGVDRHSAMAKPQSLVD